VKHPNEIRIIADLFVWLGWLSAILSAVAVAVASTASKKENT